jgi:pyridinium-3,5-biscarboxylic acid mononucleotide sulfurtransferase
MNAPYRPPEPVSAQIAALESVLRSIGEVAVAVSGGVDSLTLAAVAHRVLDDRVSMFHAVSPAVPPDATDRTRQLADREGWALTVLDAGEFGSGDYMRNPVNRCFYCKTSLYGAIRPHTTAQMVSGTNLNDLGEYRPGLIAAKEHGVRHPLVEAQIDKQGVRAISRYLGLGDVAELPASPCLSSRIETGIAIDPSMLGCVHQSERLVNAALTPKTVRCRVRASGVVIELDEASLTSLTDDWRLSLTSQLRALFERAGFCFEVTFAPYRVGSAFLHFKRLEK